jgi:hypothetical protein
VGGDFCGCGDGSVWGVDVVENVSWNGKRGLLGNCM